MRPFEIADKPYVLPLTRLRERGKGRGWFFKLLISNSLYLAPSPYIPLPKGRGTLSTASNGRECVRFLLAA